MKYVKLKEVCEIKKGQSITKQDTVEGNIPVVAGGQKPSCYHNVANRAAGVITISASGAYAGFISYWDQPIFASDCTTLRPIGNDLSVEYLFRLLKAKQNHFYGLQRGAGQPHVYGKDFEDIEIPLPPIETQRKIADVLDKAQSLIDKRKEQLEKLDELVQSVFLEMFGDPDKNPKHWGKGKLEDLADIVSGITKGRKVSGQDILISIPYMRVANVQDGHLVLEDIKEIEVLPHEIKKYRLEYGDLLMTEGGDPDKLGRGAIWRNEIPTCIHQNHIFRVRLDKKMVMSEYMCYLVGSPYGKIYFLRAAKQTTGIATINSKQLKGFPVLLPPPDLQNQFAQFVEKTEQQKARMQQSLVEMENNFSSLMQRAFKGDLF